MVTVSLHTFALKSHSLLKEFQHELTWPLSKCSVLRTELLRQSFRLFFPLWATLLWAAFPPYSRAGSIIKGEDVFNEERSQRFDFVRHFHLLILRQKSLSGLPGGWIGSSVSSHAPIVWIYTRAGEGFIWLHWYVKKAGQWTRFLPSTASICCFFRWRQTNKSFPWKDFLHFYFINTW